MNIKKAIIIAEGLDTCFHSSTKTQPFEEKPVIHYIVEEAVKSGIESIIIVTGISRNLIGDQTNEAEETILEKEKNELLRNVQSMNESAYIQYICQQNLAGLGDAILCTEEFIDDDPFAVLLVDEIFMSKTPPIKQLLQVFDDFENQIIGVKEVPVMDVNKFEIIDSSLKCDDIHLVTDLIENPSPRIAPSNIAVMGRYILKPSIFPILRKSHKALKREDQFSDALTEISRLEGLLALELEGNSMTLEYH